MGMVNTARKMLEFAEGTREDFHEPDEQDIKFVGVVGTSLDNAFGDSISPDAIERGYQEVVVLCKRGRDGWKFNLADLFALAKLGAQMVMASEPTGVR